MVIVGFVPCFIRAEYMFYFRLRFRFPRRNSQWEIISHDYVI